MHYRSQCHQSRLWYRFIIVSKMIKILGNSQLVLKHLFFTSPSLILMGKSKSWTSNMSHSSQTKWSFMSISLLLMHKFGFSKSCSNSSFRWSNPQFTIFDKQTSNINAKIEKKICSKLKENHFGRRESRKSLSSRSNAYCFKIFSTPNSIEREFHKFIFHLVSCFGSFLMLSSPSIVTSFTMTGCSTKLIQIFWLISGKEFWFIIKPPFPPKSFIWSHPQKHYSLWLRKCVITRTHIVAHPNTHPFGQQFNLVEINKNILPRHESKPHYQEPPENWIALQKLLRSFIMQQQSKM